MAREFQDRRKEEERKERSRGRTRTQIPVLATGKRREQFGLKGDERFRNIRDSKITVYFLSEVEAEEQ